MYDFQKTKYIKHLLKIFCIILAVITIDQISKIFILYKFEYNEKFVLLDILNITLTFNKGISFSMLSNDNMIYVIYTLTSISMVLICIMIFYEKIWSIKLLLSTILGGAISNMIDRIRIGYVIDFIEVHYKEIYYPVFNIADISITLSGVMIFIIYYLKKE